VINSTQIISDTVNVFNQTYIQTKKFADLPKLSEPEYKSIHYHHILPTKIKIDTNQFLTEIQQYDNNFVQWGKKYTHLPRFGLALVNQDGLLKDNDPINASLYEWNKDNPNNPIFETDCTTHTEVMNLNSLNPLNVLKGYYCRSNILKWGQDAEFMPHVDTLLPAPWIRLWGCTHPESMELNFYDNDDNKLNNIEIEPGRIYVIDTLLVHTAKSTGPINYQFFLSVNALASNTIKELIL
jgi:hypothetical protein